MQINEVLFSTKAFLPYKLGELALVEDELIFKKYKGFGGQGTRAGGQLSLVLFKKLLMLPGLFLSPEKELLRIKKSDITEINRARDKAGNNPLLKAVGGLRPDSLIIKTNRQDIPEFRLSFESPSQNFDNLINALNT